MKIIERLREQVAHAINGPKGFSANAMCEWEDADNAVYAALPALLAVVEAQAAEIENAREFRNRLVEYTLSYLDAKGERILDMERRLIAGYSKLKEATDAALRALEGGAG